VSIKVAAAESAGVPAADLAADGLPDPAARPVRRSFTAEHRARVVAEYEAAPRGQEGAVLRREGLCQSQIRERAAAREALGAGSRRRPHRAGRAGPAAGGEPAADPRAGQVAGGGGDHGKTARALGGRLREPVHAVAVGDAMSAAFTGLRAAGVPARRACALIGRSRATHYRHARGPVHGPAPARAVAGNGQALSGAGRAAVLALISAEAYADLSIGQIWARELDAGSYLCSASSMDRIARAAGQSRERRRQASHPAKVRPELLADGPSQVWTWDITKLRGPVDRGDLPRRTAARVRAYQASCSALPNP
jgi:hypothetical protein